MDLTQLKYFKTVAETQNMSKASKIQFVSQSALSKSIKSLEEELGGPLFNRFGKSLVLNDGGKILLRYANKILNARTELENELADYFLAASSTVSLSINVGTSLLAAVLPSFMEKNPNIRLQIVQNDNSMPDPDNYDICINCSTEKPQDPATRIIFEEDFVLAIPSSHPLAKVPRIYMKDIRGENFIQLQGEELIRLTNDSCRAAGFEPHIILYSDYPRTTIDLVELGIGITFMPAISWSFVDSDRLVRKHVEDLKMHRYISLSWRQNGYLSNGATLLRDYLIDYYAQFNQQ